MADNNHNDGGKALLLGAGGIAVGALISNLVSKPSSVKASPGDTTVIIDSDIRQAIAAILTQNIEINAKLSSVIDNFESLITALGGHNNNRAQVSQVYKIYDQLVRTSTPPIIHSDFMVDFRGYDRMLIKVENSLDQNVTIQTIGNVFESFERTVNINGPFLVPPGSNITIGLAWDDWHPYVGVNISIPVAATTGRLTVYDMMQTI